MAAIAVDSQLTFSSTAPTQNTHRPRDLPRRSTDTAASQRGQGGLAPCLVGPDPFTFDVNMVGTSSALPPVWQAGYSLRDAFDSTLPPLI
jgi:hypothetical protein